MARSFLTICTVVACLAFGSSVSAESLQAAYDASGPGDGYDKLLILDAGTGYTGGLTADRGVRSCIRGNGALVDLEQKSVWAAGYNTRLDIERCVLTGGFSGVYISEDATGVLRNNTITGNEYGVTSWMGRADLVIENNIIAGNDVYGIYCREYFEPIVRYNTVWGNPLGNYMKNCG